MPAKRIEISELPICDACYNSYLDAKHMDTFYEIGVLRSRLIVCEKCFREVCSYCCEDIPEVATSANGKVYCSHGCMVKDAKLCNEQIVGF